MTDPTVKMTVHADTVPSRIYIAGPVGANDAVRPARVAAALVAAEHMRAKGYHSFVPHVACEWAASAGYEAAMVECMAWLAVCHAVLRIPGQSPGADREVARARELGLPVYFAPEEVPDAAR